ncbi:MAG: hypothetical protein LBF38_03310, partial [Deltaproteobacteria bacterium]|nr:hypothetical protein [Deltaproteobacteria bacterium]
MIYWLGLGLILGALFLETYALRRLRAKVPLRIHIHGTRGKSTLTRLVAKTLRDQGLKTLAKTTGDNPEYILPDASFLPIRRTGPPRVMEQAAALRLAARLGAQALVVEGMALEKESIHQSENLLQSTHVVIANARPDHAETMGPGRLGVIAALSLLFPKNGRLYVSNDTGRSVFQTLAAKKNLPFFLVNCPNPLNQAPELCRALTQNIPSGLAEKKSSRPNPSQPGPPVPGGSLSISSQTLAQNSFPMAFLDLFSANDRVSSALAWQAYPHKNSPNALKVAIFSTRSDR